MSYLVKLDAERDDLSFLAIALPMVQTSPSNAKVKTLVILYQMLYAETPRIKAQKCSHERKASLYVIQGHFSIVQRQARQ